MHDVLQRLVAPLWRTMYYKGWLLHYDARCTTNIGRSIMTHDVAMCQGWSLSYDPGCTAKVGRSVMTQDVQVTKVGRSIMTLDVKK